LTLPEEIGGDVMKKVMAFAINLFFAMLLMSTITVYAGDERVVELEELRTTNSKLYTFGNSKYVYEYYSSPIHYFDGEDYVEYSLSSDYDEIMNFYYTNTGNYQVNLFNDDKFGEVSISYYDNNNITLNYNNSKEKLLSEISVTSNDSYELESSNGFMIEVIPESSGLVTRINYDSNYEFLRHSYKIHLGDLKLEEVEGEYYLINIYNSPIYKINDYYLIDSAGVVDMNVEVEISQVTETEIKVEIAPSSYINDEANICYPITLVGGLSFTMVFSDEIIRDKTIVKDTFEWYDTSIITVAKQTYYPFQYTPVTLSEYLSYSILEIDLSQFLSPNITVTHAILSLERNQYNINSKVPLSEITNYEYDQIDGFTQYNKMLIFNPFVSSSNISYDITDEVVNHTNTLDPTVILELSPQFINLGTYSIRYMNFVSENANQTNSPLLTIEYEDSISNFGIAPDYYATSSTDLNCFGYALRMYDTWVNIYNANGFIVFYNNQFNETDFISDIVPAVLFTINDQQFYSARQIDENDMILSNEYRIALRIGDVNTTSTLHTFLPSNIQQTAQDDFHFMIQLEDGNWAQKLGQYPSEELLNIYDVSTFYWDYDRYINNALNFVPNFYNSTTVYFAISHDKQGMLW
jgi:hypothetical protein